MREVSYIMNLVWLRSPTLLLLMFISILLAGCASSNVSRDVSSNIDKGVIDTKDRVDHMVDGDLADSYQNTSQATKGALLGGAAGAVTGVMSTTVGFIPGTAIGAILGASYGAYIDSNASFMDKLENRGANVIVLGDQVLIVIPSSRIFNPESANINPSAYSTLKMVSQYINSYTKMLVKINVYTSDLGSPQANLSMSQEQANAVEKFLVASGVNARVLYAQGYGGTHLVDKSERPWDGSDNYRIEITLEKLHV